MSNYRRLRIPGGSYFFTVALRRRGATLLTDRIDDLRAAYGEVQTSWPFETRAICVLPDHLHAVWTLPEGDADFSTRWRLIKSGFTRRLPKTEDLADSRRRNERGIWQRRFWEHALRGEDWDSYIDYVHMNPVKHGFVEHPSERSYSSYHRYMSASGLRDVSAREP